MVFSLLNVRWSASGLLILWDSVCLGQLKTICSIIIIPLQVMYTGAGSFLMRCECVRWECPIMTRVMVTSSLFYASGWYNNFLASSFTFPSLLERGRFSQHVCHFSIIITSIYHLDRFYRYAVATFRWTDRCVFPVDIPISVYYRQVAYKKPCGQPNNAQSFIRIVVRFTSSWLTLCR